MPLAHRQRFRRWQNLCPPATRFLSSKVDQELVPIVEAQGFARVDICFGDAEWTVSGNEIALERVSADLVDSFTFSFEKYRSPRFQVHFSRRSTDESRAFVRSGSLVPRASKYYHFWGKPWWFPSRFWTERASARTIAEVATRLSESFRFLDSGERGSSVSKRVDPPGSSGDARQGDGAALDR